MVPFANHFCPAVFRFARATEDAVSIPTSAAKQTTLVSPKTDAGFDAGSSLGDGPPTADVDYSFCGPKMLAIRPTNELFVVGSATIS